MQQLHIYTAYFDFTIAQIVINCTLKYALRGQMMNQDIYCDKTVFSFLIEDLRPVER